MHFFYPLPPSVAVRNPHQKTALPCQLLSSSEITDVMPTHRGTSAVFIVGH